MVVGGWNSVPSTNDQRPSTRSRLTSHDSRLSAMADITIQDLLVWEPRLQLARRPLLGMPATNDLEEREISWAVTIRASAPMLQPLRGGELVLLPERIVSESGLALPILLRELSGLHAGAADLERALASTRDLAAIIRTAGEFLDSPVALMSARGAILEQTGNAVLPSSAVRTVQTMHAQREWREQRYL